jgi:hypothetical protein
MSKAAPLVLSAALIVAAFAAGAAALDAATPPTLTGEAFLDFHPTTHVTCTGSEGTLTFSASGVAAGPYPGTFSETGTATVSSTVTGPVLAFSASFTIDSPVGHVEGTKQQVQAAPTQGSCANLGPPEGPFLPFAEAVLFDPSVAYTATIQTAQGSFQDRGFAFVHVAGCEPVAEPPFDCPETIFQQLFDSSLPEPVPAGPATVTLQPAAMANPVGSTHTVTATATNAAGQPVQSVTILFTVEGSVMTTGSCTTDASGQCTFTYSGPLLPGADVITGCADSNGNGTVDAGEPCGTATKAWVLPVSTPGLATGGGKVPEPAADSEATFAFTAKSTDAGVRGSCTVIDDAAATSVKCLDAIVFVQTPTHATFFGTATVNGISTSYRIDVEDLGEPGTDMDTFHIVTASGYQAGGPVDHGDVQVHDP